MSRRKRQLKKICSNITIEAYEMLEQLTNRGELYMSQALEECIRGRYYAVSKSNTLIDINNNSIIDNMQEELSLEYNQKNLEEAKAAFIARRNARKGSASNV